MSNKDEIVAGLYLDLLKVQQEIESVDKDAKNPFFNSNYATLGATIEACKSILNKNNFIVIQPLQSDENGVYVCTTLIHTSGGKIESKMRINQKEQNNPQAQGSAITYARRYSLQSILCMNEEDDDGNSATGKPQEKKVNSNCEHLRTSDHQVTKDGNNKGKWFKVCEDCKDENGKKTFIGWIPSPEQ